MLVTVAVALASWAWAQTDVQAQQGFEPIAAVLKHPRCLNCHQEDVPLQSDNSRPHVPRVLRGADGSGASAMRCTNCHRDANNAASGVPGALHWQLAPASMAWGRLSVAELCRALKDPVRNGNRSLPAVVEHVERDPLIRWAFDPGGHRTPIPISHLEFVGLVKAWVEAGGACPQ